jgi:prophage maintenance system killer protein
VSDPLFLSPAQVGGLHRLSIERFGGADGIRDPALFESAVIHPQQVYFYTQADLFEVAAA